MSDLATSAKLHLWYVQDLGDLGDLCKVAFVVCTGRHMQPREGIRLQWSLGLLGVAFVQVFDRKTKVAFVQVFDRKTKAAFVQVFENQNTFHNVLIAIPGCETTPVCDKFYDGILYATQGRHRQTTVVGLATSEKLRLYKSPLITPPPCLLCQPMR